MSVQNQELENSILDEFILHTFYFRVFSNFPVNCIIMSWGRNIYDCIVSLWNSKILWNKYSVRSIIVLWMQQCSHNIEWQIWSQSPTISNLHLLFRGKFDFKRNIWKFQFSVGSYETHLSKCMWSSAFCNFSFSYTNYRNVSVLT